jgi:hypothetical protein
MTYDKTNPPSESIRERGAIMAAIVQKGWTPVYVGPVFPGDKHTQDTAAVISLMPEGDRWKDGTQAYQVHTAAKGQDGWSFVWGRYDLDVQRALKAATDKTPGRGWE